MLPSSRSEAAAIGAKRYSTGKPCKHGHTTERMVVNGTCVERCRTILKKCYIKGASVKKEKQNSYYKNNRNARLKYAGQYRIANKDRRNAHHRERYRNDPEYRMYFKIRRQLKRLTTCIGSGKVYSSSVLGYTADDLRVHIELLFTVGMTWNNAKEWHIDHIKPISAFIRENITDPAAINALSNLRPLWATENLRKGSAWSVDDTGL